MPIVADETPRPGFLAGIAAILLALALLVSFCSGDPPAGEQEARDAGATIRVFAVLAAIAIAFAGWRVWRKRREGDHSLQIITTTWDHAGTIEAAIHFGVAESIADADVALVRAQRRSSYRSPSWSWTAGDRPGTIMVRGHTGSDQPLGLCYIEATVRTSSGKTLRARFLITVD